MSIFREKMMPTAQRKIEGKVIEYLLIQITIAETIKIGETSNLIM
jgi:hypothetical protein